MKTIKMVTEITAMAEARACWNMRAGQARRGNYMVNYTKSSYSECAELYHYGTLTARVITEGDGWYAAKIYGESRSDADSVNTFLSRFDIEERYTYKPVNGGFVEVETA